MTRMTFLHGHCFIGEELELLMQSWNRSLSIFLLVSVYLVLNIDYHHMERDLLLFLQEFILGIANQQH